MTDVSVCAGGGRVDGGAVDRGEAARRLVRLTPVHVPRAGGIDDALVDVYPSRWIEARSKP